MTTRYSYSCAALLFLLQGLAGNAHAQDTSGHSSRRENVLSNVVITGQYKPVSTDAAVQRIRVIDSKKIAAMGAQNLRDVLLNEMNVSVAQDPSLGSSVQIQGVTGQNVKILIDGVPVIGRQNGNVDIAQLNTYNIERVELIEGPMSVTYGTDALAGTINIITRSKIDNKWEAGINAYYETIGKYNLNANAGYHKGKHTVMLGGVRNFSDGWSPGIKMRFFDFSARPGDSTRATQWDPKEEYNANLQYVWASGTTKLRFKSDYFYDRITNRDTPRIDLFQGYNTGKEDVYNTTRFNNAVFADATVLRNKKLTFLAAYNYYKRLKNTFAKDMQTLERPLGAPEDQDTSSYTEFNSRATISAASSDVFRYEAGYDISIESGTGKRVLDHRQEIGNYAAYGSLEYSPFRALTLRPGLRAEYNTAYDAPLTPSLNIRYELVKNLVLRASYAKGFRAPGVKELYFEFKDTNHDIYGNPDLKAERSDNYNVSLTYNNSYNALFYKVDASGFYNNITNMINLIQTDPNSVRYTYGNIDHYKTHGVQLNLTGNYKNWAATVGGSYIGRYNTLSEEENSPAKAFSYAPELRTNITYSLSRYGLTASFFLKYTGRMPGYVLIQDAHLNNVIALRSMSDYTMADISVSKSFRKQVSLTLGMKNIFNVMNVSGSISGTSSGTAHSSATGSAISTGRSFFMSIGYKFSQQ